MVSPVKAGILAFHVDLFQFVLLRTVENFSHTAASSISGDDFQAASILLSSRFVRRQLA
jgi:hypothetical protein